MNYSIIALTSVTAAKRVERAALNSGIICTTLQTPKILSKYGCSHSVRVKQALTNDVVAICGQLGVQIRGIYLEKISGKGKIEYEKVD